MYVSSVGNAGGPPAANLRTRARISGMPASTKRTGLATIRQFDDQRSTFKPSKLAGLHEHQTPHVVLRAVIDTVDEVRHLALVHFLNGRRGNRRVVPARQR